MGFLPRRAVYLKQLHSPAGHLTVEEAGSVVKVEAERGARVVSGAQTAVEAAEKRDVVHRLHSGDRQRCLGVVNEVVAQKRATWEKKEV